ncbi:AfsR/SARP family transcriptional regulator [Solihabitans fulvus]|uniref:AfsR/SARP family transcriptional regulator n=1 Tax=Solihabitans fulvus TaxID=1892852 RepID=UPI001661CDDD|nr:tetratricopeptide repeat protein [Solihabitans fulvus]
MEFRILGPVEAWGSAGQARLAGAKQVALLSTLLLHANQVVSVDRLVDAVWADEPPVTVTAALQTYVFRLRRTLSAVEPDAGLRLTFTSGYRLRVEPDELDLEAFRAHVDNGRAALAAGRLDEASKELHTGLSLWRGTPLTGTSGRYFEAQAARLAEERLSAVEERVEVDLARGRAAELVPELHDLTSANPLRERLRGQLMVALFRAGRQAEALQAFQDARAVLVEELGVDPGPELAELHQRILRGDAELAAPPPPSTRAAARNDLPGDIIDFTGREPEMTRLLAALPAKDSPASAVVIEAIDGMAGVGKTTLAVHAAHHLTDRYPDAQLFIDLHGHTTEHEATDPAAALDTLLRALGVAGDQIPDELDQRAALWRAQLADRRALVVLDNAASATQVRPLLPGNPACLTLITSRRRLSDLDAARILSIDPLPVADAVTLFARIAGADRAGDSAAVREVVELCGFLPLAIRIAAARLRTRPAWTVAHLTGRLHEGQRRLSELTIGDRSVAATFALSYQHLSPDQQRLFRLLGLAPGAEFDAYAAAALADLDLDDADQLLEELVDIHLLQQPTPGRYRFHDLLRQHAAATALAADSEQDRRTAVVRLLDYYLHAASLATRPLNPGATPPAVDVRCPPAHTPDVAEYGAAMRWLDSEHANITASIAYAADHGLHAHTWQLPQVAGNFFLIRGHLQEWIGSGRLALTAARTLGDAHAEADTLKHLGVAHWQVGRYELAEQNYREALVLYRQLGDREGEASTLNNLALINRLQGRYAEALEHFLLSHEVSREIGDRRGEAVVLANLGTVHYRLGRYDQALDDLIRSLAVMRELAHRRGEGHVLNDLGNVYRALGRHDEAFEHVERALAVRRDLGDRWGEATTLTNLGNVLRGQGRFEEAVARHDEALALIREIGDPGAEGEMRNDLADTHRAAGDADRALGGYRAALTLAEQVKDRYQQARAHEGIGRLLRERDPAQARQHWQLALEILTELGFPQADEVRAELDELDN